MRVLAALLLLVSIALPAAAQQTYPTRLVRLVVAFPPGGTTDVIARLLAQQLSEMWRQPVIVDNRPGAGGTIGSEAVARAAPDGYTLLVSPPGPVTTNALIYAKLPYDPAAFEPVTVVATAPNLLLVNPTRVSATTVPSLVEAAKTRVDPLSYASQGIGTTSHLSGVSFSKRTGLELVHVPYRGSAPALNDLLSGQVDMMFDSMGNSLGHIATGALRALATGSIRRSTRLPDLPTLIEAGYPNFVSVVSYYVVAPAGTPLALRETIAAMIGRVVGEPEIAARLVELGATPTPSRPDQAGALMMVERQTWSQLIRDAGIRAD